MLRRRSLPGAEKGRAQFGSIVYTTHMGNDEPAYDADNPVVRISQPVQEEAFLTDAIAREAVRFIRGRRDQPFALLVSFNAVHSPLQAPDSYMTKFESISDIHRRIFAGMLANLDDGVGEILSALRELTSSNAPLRGEESDVYEGGLRVPFVVQWPGQLPLAVPQGVVEERPVLSLDIAATALGVGGAETPGNLDGVNLLPYLRDTTSGRPHEELFWRQGTRMAVRAGDWKLLRNDWRNPDAWDLYDLASDPQRRKTS